MEPIPIETANGIVTVTHRCRVHVRELNLDVWAYLHEDTVFVLSLGLLVNRSGFSHSWKPGKIPELSKGNKRYPLHPHFNVPFIYSGYARGNPAAIPSVARKDRQVGQPPASSSSSSSSSAPAKADATDTDDEDDSPGLIDSDEENLNDGEVSYGVPRAPPVPSNPVPRRRSRG